jgi:CDP-diacylglycerol--glycerol-3-phosphate 3-phosphatidyltransferase
MKLSQIPNFLTLFRIIASPLIVIAFYLDGLWSNLIATFLFFLAGLSDFLDGYIARKFKVKSNLGACFDPIADKMAVILSLLMLSVFSDNDFIIISCAVIIICREIIISGFREFLSNKGSIEISVSNLSKWKTAFQMMAIGCLICTGHNFAELLEFAYYDFIRYFFILANKIGYLFLIISTILTVNTGYSHIHKNTKYLHQ